jgi:hypothetical protein
MWVRWIHQEARRTEIANQGVVCAFERDRLVWEMWLMTPMRSEHAASSHYARHKHQVT